MTTVIRGDHRGGTYVQGLRRYPIDHLTWPEDHDPVATVDRHLAAVWQDDPRHPDIDLLLEARGELTAHAQEAS